MINYVLHCHSMKSNAVHFVVWSRPIYQYSSMAPRISAQTSIVSVVVVVFISKHLGNREVKKTLKVMTRNHRSHVRILIYRTWTNAATFALFDAIERLFSKVYFEAHLR